MPTEVACPRCNRRLGVSPDAESRWLTCPRCLAPVRNPRFSGSANVVLDASPIPMRQEEVTGKVCPTCGHDVKRDWHFCPYCEQSLRPRTPDVRRYRSLADDDAVFDRRGVDVGLVSLGILLVIGVFAYLATGGLWKLLDLRNVGGLVASGVVVVGALVGGLLAIRAGFRDESDRGWSRILGCFATGAGATCIIVFATCMGFFYVCARGRVP